MEVSLRYTLTSHMRSPWTRMEQVRVAIVSGPEARKVSSGGWSQKTKILLTNI